MCLCLLNVLIYECVVLKFECCEWLIVNALAAANLEQFRKYWTAFKALGGFSLPLPLTHPSFYSKKNNGEMKDAPKYKSMNGISEFLTIYCRVQNKTSSEFLHGFIRIRECL